MSHAPQPSPETTASSRLVAGRSAKHLRAPAHWAPLVSALMVTMVIGCGEGGASSRVDNLQISIPAVAPNPELERVDPCELPERTSRDFPVQLAHDLDAVLAESFDAVRAPGVLLYAKRADGEHHIATEGILSRRGREPLQPTMRARIGSITKTFTAALVLRHAAAGHWTLDDPVVDYLEEDIGAELDPRITLRQLLSHTAGLYNYTDDLAFLGEAREPIAPADLLRFALERGAVGAPGERYLYSNTGYIVLGMALEYLLGLPYHVILREELLDPLGLESIYLEQFEPTRCSPPQGHVATAPSEDVAFSTTWSWAAGGLVSDAASVCRWAELLWASEEVLEEPWRQEMLQPSPPASNYGLGVQFFRPADQELVGHTGSTLGFNVRVQFDPRDGRCLTIFTNDFGARSGRPQGGAWELLTP